jgi:TolB protein
MPNWSLQSKKIAHIRYLTGVFSSEIFVMDTDGTNPLRLTFNRCTDYYPKYSSDGKKIAFTSQPYGRKPQIWTMNSDGTGLEQLTYTQGYSCDWSPDGDWIVYADSRAVSGRLWLIRSDGTENHQLTF